MLSSVGATSLDNATALGNLGGTMLQYTISGTLLAIAWGCSVIMSCIGFSRMLSRLLKLPIDPSPTSHVALHAGWGMAIWIALGGALNLFGIVSPALLQGIVLLGCTYFLYGLIRHPISLPPPPQRAFWRLSFFIAMGTIALRAADWEFNSNDDLEAYIFFPLQMLQTGTCIDSYSWRRLSSFGGQSFMQALCLAPLPFQYINLFDRALCLALSVLSFSSIIASRKLHDLRLAHVLLVLLALFPAPLVNIGSIWSSAFFVFVLVQTIEFVAQGKVDPTKSGLLLGLIAAAYYSLKGTNFLFFGIFFGLYFLLPMLSRTASRAQLMRESAAFSISFIVLIYPWARLEQISCGTCLYPILKGFQPSDYQGAVYVIPLLDRLYWIGQVLALPLVIFHLLSVVLFKESGSRPVLAPLALASIAQLLVLVGSFAVIDYVHEGTAYRYAMPPLVVASLVALLSLSESGPLRILGFFRLPAPRMEKECLLGWSIALLALLVVSGANRSLAQTGAMLVPSPVIAISSSPIDMQPVPMDQLLAEHHAFQSLVPPGEPIFAIVPLPFLLDQKRNPILIGDLLGASSPPPQMPFFQGPAPMVRYFLSQHIHYVLCADFNNVGQNKTGRYCIYARYTWQHWLATPTVVWRHHAPYFLDAMDNLEAIEPSNTVHRDLTLVLIKLPEQ